MGEETWLTEAKGKTSSLEKSDHDNGDLVVCSHTHLLLATRVFIYKIRTEQSMNKTLYFPATLNAAIHLDQNSHSSSSKQPPS